MQIIQPHNQEKYTGTHIHNVVRLSKDILAQLPLDFEVEKVYFSSHYSVRIQTKEFGKLCLKIHVDALPRTNLKYSKVIKEKILAWTKLKPYFRDELIIFKRITNQQNWCPKLRFVADNEAWYIRDWSSGKTLENFDDSDRTKSTVLNFWAFMSGALSDLDTLDNLLVKPDIIAANISFDGAKFRFFDPVQFQSQQKAIQKFKQFNKQFYSHGYYEIRGSRFYEKPSTATKSSVIQLQRSYNLYAFAELLLFLVTGNHAPKYAGLTITKERYMRENQKLQKKLKCGLKSFGFSENECDFLVSCLDPSQLKRPASLNPPSDYTKTSP